MAIHNIHKYFRSVSIGFSD